MNKATYIVYNLASMMVEKTFDGYMGAGAMVENRDDIVCINRTHPVHKDLLPKLIWPEGIYNPLPDAEKAKQTKIKAERDAKEALQRTKDRLFVMDWIDRQATFYVNYITLEDEFSQIEEDFVLLLYKDDHYRDVMSLGLDLTDAVLNRETQIVTRQDVHALIDKKLLPDAHIVTNDND